MGKIFETQKAFEENSVEKALKLLDGYNSTVDYPANTFGPKWLEEFPDAKFVLTIRESPEEWYREGSLLLNNGLTKVFLST